MHACEYICMTASSATIRRHHAIRDLLRHAPVATQEALGAALASRGFQVTQSTLSRDLRALGVIKTVGGYALPDAVGGMSHGGNGRERLATVLGDHLIDAIPAGTLVVLRTAPGHAQPVGLALDASDVEGMVGNVAGDDTIFVATPSNTEARRLASVFREMAGMPGMMGAA